MKNLGGISFYLHNYAAYSIVMHLVCSMKTARQNLVRDMISMAPIYTQEELRKGLAQKGIQVNQATLSRDLREIGVVKTANGYSLPTQDDTGGSPLPSLSHLLNEFVVDVREAENQLVLKTTPGSAQPVAAGLDSSGGRKSWARSPATTRFW